MSNYIVVPEFKEPKVDTLHQIQQKYCRNSLCGNIGCDECMFSGDNTKEFKEWLDENGST